MGQVKKPHIWMLIVCFCMAAFMVHRQSDDFISRPIQPLHQALGKIDGWQGGRPIAMGSNIVEELQLDDYFFQSFSNEKGEVTLYIAYYDTAKKVGAAHDPMVCYPGQGWRVTDYRKGEIDLCHPVDRKVSFSTMIADLDARKDLVLYWFQAHDQAVEDTFSQKLVIFRQKLLGDSENSAFVRITTSLQDQSEEEARELILSFVQDFYPAFLNYVEGEQGSVSVES